MRNLKDLNHATYVIDNVTVVDPVSDRVFPGHVGVDEGRVAYVEEGPAPDGGDKQVYDGEGLHLAPGFVDIHVHLREPGQEYKETVATGSRAAAAGGFTSIACMPNTKPALDERSVIEYILAQARIAGLAKVYPIAAATRGRKGEILSEYVDLVDAGAVAVSDDGSPVATADMVRRVLEYSTIAGVPLIEHCEDMSATGEGIMNEGYYSTLYGMKGAPAHSETLGLARDLVVLESVPGARLHAAHMSARTSVDQLRWAKARGLAVTAETAPHYLCLTDADLETYNTCLKINPPLRGAEDRDALIAALVDGTIDCIASDHAPHALQEKEVEFEAAPPGSVGLETTLGLIITHLVEPGHLSLSRAIALIANKPAGCIGLSAGTLETNAAADLVLFDPAEEWTVDADGLHSKSKNSAFHGHTLRGRVQHTILDGRRVSPVAAAT